MRKFDSTNSKGFGAKGGVESNKFWINFCQIFRIFFHLLNQSNWTNFEQIHFLKIWLYTILESNRIDFHPIFEIFLSFGIIRNANFWIEWNQLRRNLNPPPLFGTPIAIKSLLQGGLLTLLSPIVSSKVNLYRHEMSLSWYFVIVLWIDPIPK